MIISKTPLRISFAGGGTDLPSFFRENGYGAVLSTTIDNYIYVAIKRHTSLFKERIRLNYSEAELVDDIDKIKNPIIRECLKFLQIDDRLFISTIADAPGSSGLGSSSSFCVGLLNALYRYKGIVASSGRLAEEAAYIEIEMLGRPIGKQDHYAAAYGGLNYYCFNSNGTVSIVPVSVSKHVINTIFSCMVSFWTGISRPSEIVLFEQDKNISKNRDYLLAMRQQAKELLDLLTSNEFSIEVFSKIIHEGWMMKRKLASRISNPFIDRCYNIAIKNGALGGKISGAGGGGFLNIFAEIAKQDKITKALLKEGLLQFKFGIDSSGSKVSVLE